MKENIRPVDEMLSTNNIRDKAQGPGIKKVKRKKYKE
jgi:hypothetical protein